MKLQINSKIKVICAFVIVVVAVAAVSLYLLWYKPTQDQNNKTCDTLSRTVYDIVEESCINYGDIKYSNYRDIISEENYDWMYYLRKINYYDPDRPYLDRSEYEDILMSYHTMPYTKLVDSNTAISTYEYCAKVVVNNDPEMIKTPKYDDKHKIYDCYSYSGGRSTCTVTWKKQDDGKWVIMNFYESP